MRLSEKTEHNKIYTDYVSIPCAIATHKFMLQYNGEAAGRYTNIKSSQRRYGLIPLRCRLNA